MVKPTLSSLSSSSLSLLPSKPAIETETVTDTEIDIDVEQEQEEFIKRKRRLLLQRSAKGPSMRLRLLQQQRRREEDEKEKEETITTKTPMKNSRAQNNQQHKKNKKRRVGVDVVSVSFDTQNEEIISVQSHEDYSKKERVSYYVQKDEYADIKQNIHRTIKFLKSTTDSTSQSSTNGSNSSTSSSSDSDTATANCTNIEEHCIRGLESLAEDYVGEHKRRIQRSSKSAVFRFQEDKRKVDNKNENEAVATLALAEIYKRCTAGCQDIARRWGHFDAIDAGIVSTAS